MARTLAQRRASTYIATSRGKPNRIVGKFQALLKKQMFCWSTYIPVPTPIAEPMPKVTAAAAAPIASCLMPL